MRVKKELNYLKNKAIEAAGKLVNDDTISNLQNSIKWFQKEAISLDGFLDEQKRDV